MLHGGARPEATDTHGLGLRAVAPIPAGTVVWFPCPNCPTWTPERLRRLPGDVVDRLDTWGHLLTDGTLLVPCAGACLMNHSCAANVLDFGLDFGVAVTDIPVGAELTCDYGTFSADSQAWSMRCLCGTPGCRGEVGTVDSLDPDQRRRWTDRLTTALPLLSRVEQPLGRLLAATSPTYRRVLEGAHTVDDADVGHSVVRPGWHVPPSHGADVDARRDEHTVTRGGVGGHGDAPRPVDVQADRRVGTVVVDAVQVRGAEHP